MTFDYTAPVTLTITNKVDLKKSVACDAGTPVQKVEMLYEDVIKTPCLKWDYLFNSDGTFVVGKISEGVIVKSPAGTKKADDNDYVVLAHKKFKNTDRKVPAYRTFNGKVLKVDESVKFVTERKDEVVFYEKVAEAFGSVTTDGKNWIGGELELKVEATGA